MSSSRPLYSSKQYQQQQLQHRALSQSRVGLRVVLTAAATVLLLPVVTAFCPSSYTPAPSHKRHPLFKNKKGKNKTIKLLMSSTAVTAVNGDQSATTTTSSSAAAFGSGEAQASSSPLNNIRLNVFEKARTVTSVCTSGTLCTISYGQPGMEGAPFGSFVDYVLDDDGNPVLLMNEMSVHTMNIQQASAITGGITPPMVTLFTQLSAQQQQEQQQPQSQPGSPNNKKQGLQDVSRCSITGTLEKIPPSAPDMDTVRMRYSLTHTYADQVMNSPKFAFYRLTPSHIYFVGGFGVLAKWVDPQDYKTAKADILAKEAAGILERINRDHLGDLKLTAMHLLGVDTPLVKIRVTNVDRLGLDIRVTSQLRSRRNKLVTDEFRVGFRIPVLSVEDAKSEILKIFQEAWEKGNGVSWGDEEEPGENVPIVKIASDSLE